MGIEKIENAIIDSCNGDQIMKDLLLDLLDKTNTGRSWYKEDYKNLIQKYAAMLEDNDVED